MDLRQLRYLVAVAEAKNFTVAAESLGITQPSLSAQIRLIERELGAPLFDRTGRKVRVTPIGAAFLEYAERALAEVTAGRGVVQELLGVKRGSLRVAATHVFSTRLIPEVTNAFLRAYPGIDLVVNKVHGSEVLSGILDGRFDLGISYRDEAPTDPTPPGFEWDHFLEDELVAVVPLGHPLAELRQLDLAELRSIGLALPTNDCSTRRRLDHQFRSSGIECQVRVELDDIAAILEVVRLGLCPAVIARLAITDLDGLAIVPFSRPRIALSAVVLWRRNAYRSPAALAFLGVLRGLDVQPLHLKWAEGEAGRAGTARPHG